MVTVKPLVVPLDLPLKGNTLFIKRAALGVVLPAVGFSSYIIILSTNLIYSHGVMTNGSDGSKKHMYEKFHTVNVGRVLYWALDKS